MADDNPNEDKKITVDSYTGGNNGEDLEQAYFKYKKSDSTWDFYDKDNNSKCTGLVVGGSCSFTLDEYPGLTWTITLINPCSETEVNGDWSTTTEGGLPTAETEGGTFTAQAGGGGVEEEEAVVDEELPQQDIIIFEVKSEHDRTFGAPLVGCFFSLHGKSGKYQLHGPDGKVLHENVKSHETFKFKFDRQQWEMTIDIRTLEEKAHGRWKLLEGDSDEVDGGTFQAQAGGGADEAASYASA